MMKNFRKMSCFPIKHLIAICLIVFSLAGYATVNTLPSEKVSPTDTMTTHPDSAIVLRCKIVEIRELFPDDNDQDLFYLIDVYDVDNYNYIQIISRATKEKGKKIKRYKVYTLTLINKVRVEGYYNFSVPWNEFTFEGVQFTAMYKYRRSGAYKCNNGIIGSNHQYFKALNLNGLNFIELP